MEQERIRLSLAVENRDIVSEQVKTSYSTKFKNLILPLYLELTADVLAIG